MELWGIDLELAEPITGEELRDRELRTVPIACICAQAADGAQLVWAPPADRDALDAEAARDFLRWAAQRQRAGAMVSAWNGVSFDVPRIGAVAQDMRLAAEVAADLVDPMLEIQHRSGFPVALAAVAAGLGIREEKQMQGAQAPLVWQAGERQRVIDYCLGDCSITVQVVAGLREHGAARWTDRYGRPRRQSVDLLRARDCAQLPPATAGTRAIPRSEFTGWMWAALA